MRDDATEERGREGGGGRLLEKVVVVDCVLHSKQCMTSGIQNNR